jgi:hypothetical protein
MKTRLILVVIVTLIIGFTLGMLTSAQLRLQKLKPVRFFYSEERFREGFYKTIQPDEKQKAKIDLILDKYARINSETQSTFRKEFDSNIKAMRKELDSNLTKEQLERVKEMDERRQEMIRQGRSKPRNDSSDFRDGRRHHPDQGQGPGGPPPPPFTERDSAGLPD